MKIVTVATLLIATTLPAYADDQICKPLGKLAAYAALEREAGKTMEQTFVKMVTEGRINPKEATAEWAANTVAWVYEERVSSRVAERTMLQKCRRVFKKF